MTSLRLLLALGVLGCGAACPQDDGGGDDDVGDDDVGDDDDGTLAGAPNILIVIADDLGLDLASADAAAPCFSVGDLSNDPAMPTLAGLCASGIRFSRAWATPTCSPTRASLLTGSLPSRHGVGAPVGSSNSLALDATTLPGRLADAGLGYATANIGKWHVSTGESDPNALGWDHYAGSLTGALPSYFAWDRTEDGITAPVTDYATTRAVDDAIDWLGGVQDQPWLLWLAFNAPHTPLHVPPLELHDYDDLGEPPNGMGFDAQPWVAAASQALDTELGRLVVWLQAEGEWEDTLVVFLGDNGTTGQAVDPPWGPGSAKGSLREGGVAVPLVLAGAGVSGGREVTDLVSVIDVFATALDVAGATVPTGDAVSLVPYLVGAPAEPLRQVVITEQFGVAPGGGAGEEGKAISNGEHKLICDDDGTVLLFDLGGAHDEVQDLYEEGVGAAAGLGATYEALRDRLRAELGDATLCE